MAEKHGGGVDGLNRTNEGWRWQRHDNVNAGTKEEEAALRKDF